ncbi:hypothetical protein BV22DRAFT_1126185 [Leucogyrophana mollusca]|uniref:Uncharacterized protein n=1 Tax=Leucogyrophana mollusca TaxID=85980 RepID=A0ACB8BUH5_9AGAM|nr:hypothetical protein BV22DRAFT_1126185 [Leucogyrophana mollusca]
MTVAGELEDINQVRIVKLQPRPFDDSKARQRYIYPTPPVSWFLTLIYGATISGCTIDGEGNENAPREGSYSFFPERDLPDGYELRLDAYKAAWSKCLNRIQEIIRALHSPVVDSVIDQVENAYSDELPGLPYPEIPVITVNSSSTSSSLFDEIASRLECDDLFEDSSGNYVTHIFPGECPNIMSTMKTLVSGFVTRLPSSQYGEIKRKPTTSLAIYDISLLEVWYEAVREARGDGEEQIHLVVMLHDFEQFEPAVIQDLFEICSLSIRRLPLVFVLALASPPSPSYLHATYPRSTLSLLRVRNCSLPSSEDALHEILLKTFFDPEFDPDVMIGPATIEFLTDFYTRHSPSLDTIISILQLVHMKHFEEPLTLLVSERFLPDAMELLPQPDSFPFLDSIFTRVHHSSLIPSVDHSTRWRNEHLDSLLDAVDSARYKYRRQAKILRVAFQLVLGIRRFMLRQGYKSAEGDRTLSEMMCLAIRGRFGKQCSYLCIMVKKLAVGRLDNLLDDLADFFQGLPEDICKDGEEVLLQIENARSLVEQVNDPSSSTLDIATQLGDSLSAYLQTRLVSLEESPLWDIWYTGSTPFPSELINPSLRASMFSGLLNPQDYARRSSENGIQDGDDRLLDLPDTSVMFKGYLESGKMINVFDWFESFAFEVDAQRERLKKRRSSQGERRSPSKAKGKQKQLDLGVNEEGEESEEELWKLEVQARFVRALHELDYVGLIKHTGRKADHVLRTVFDPPE